MFESIINSAKSKLGFGGDTASAILGSLLRYLADPVNGGFSGFLDKFRSAGLGSVVDSWIGGGESKDISSDQVRKALGGDAIKSIAKDAGVTADEASSGVAAMLPGVIDMFTPDAKVPDNESFFSKVGSLLSDWGSAIGGAAVGAAAAAAAVAGSAADKVGDVAEATIGKGKEVLGSGIDAVKNVGDSLDGDGGGSIFRWLIPLIIIGLLLLLGYMYCGGSKPSGNTVNANANAAKANTNTAATAVDSTFAIKADNGKYVVTGVVHDEATKKQIVDALTAQFGATNVNFDGLKVDVKAKPFAAGWWDNFAKMLPNLKDWKTGSLAFAGNAITEAAGLPAAALDQLKSLFSGWTLPSSLSGAAQQVAEKLTEVALPNGTKLQAYPGGIEDQLVKFVGSADYKAATEDTLKSKWFNFDDLNFKFGSTEIEDSSKRQLDNIVAILKAFPDVKIKVGAYTDKKGDDAANLKLSDGRAQAVKAALEKAGVGAQVVGAEGYGEQFATVDENASDEARKVDRRTAIRLVK